MDKLTLTKDLKWLMMVEEALVWDPFPTGDPPMPESVETKGKALLLAEIDRLVILGEI